MIKIKETVKTFILREFVRNSDSIELLDETPLHDSGIIDSLSTLKLVSYLEKEFSFRFKAHEVTVENLRNLNSIEEFIKVKLKEKG